MNKAITLFYLVLFSCLLISCGSEKSNTVTSYKEQGLEVSYPAGWELQSDNGLSQVADREVWIQIAENSFVGLYTFELDERDFIKDLNLDVYLDKLTRKTLSEVRYGNTTSMERSKVRYGDYSGLKVEVKTDMLGGRSTQVLGFDVEQKNTKSFVVFFVDGLDGDVSEKDVRLILGSIEITN